MFKKLIILWTTAIIFVTFSLQIVTARLSIEYIEKSNSNICAIKNSFYNANSKSIITNANPSEIYEKIIMVNKTAIEEDIAHFRGVVYFICLIYLIIVIFITIIFIRKYEKQSLELLGEEVVEMVKLKLQIENFDFVNEKTPEKK
jgi:hypothetical protein